MHRVSSEWSGCLLGSLFCLVIMGCRSSDLPPGPELNRVSEWNTNPTYSNGTVASTKRWLSSETPESVIRTPEDRWGNGFAGCMTPSFMEGFCFLKERLV